MADGDTLVVCINLKKNIAVTPLGKDSRTAATVSYEYDKAAFEGKVIDEVTTATTDDAMRTALTTYDDTLGIDITLLTDENITSVINALSGQEFTDISALSTAYKAAVGPLLIDGSVTIDKMYRYESSWDVDTIEVNIEGKYTISDGGRTYFVFNDIENGSAISEARFNIGGGWGSVAFTPRTCSWAVVDHKIDTTEKLKAILDTSSGSWGTNYINNQVKQWSSGKTTLVSDTKHSSGKMHDVDLSAAQMADGDSLVVCIYFNGYDKDAIITPGGLDDRTAATVSYKYDKEKFEQKVIDAITAADTDDAMMKALTAYDKTIGIDAALLNENNITSITDYMKGLEFTDLSGVATAYNAALENLLDKGSMTPDKMFTYQISEGVIEKELENFASSRRTYMVFNDIDQASVMKDIVFNVGKWGSNSKGKPEYSWAFMNHSITTPNDLNSILDSATGSWGTKYLAAKVLKQGTGTTTLVDEPKKSDDTMWEFSIGDAPSEVVDGCSLVICLNLQDYSVGLAAAGANDRTAATVSYRYNKAAFLESVLSAVNDAESVDDFASVLKTYKKTINIDTALIDAMQAKETGGQYLTTVYNGGTDFADLTAVKTAYDNALASFLSTNILEFNPTVVDDTTGTITATVDMLNTTSADQTYIVLLAFYGDGEKFENVYLSDAGKLTRGTMDSVTVSGTYTSTTKKYKVMVWDSLTNLKNLRSVYGGNVSAIEVVSATPDWRAGSAQYSADGKLTVTYADGVPSNIGSIVYWGDANGKLEGYSEVLTFIGTEGTFVDNTMIPEGATHLWIYPIVGTLSSYTAGVKPLVVPLGDGKGGEYTWNDTPLYELQITSDTHVGTGDDTRFGLMIDQMMELSPNSIGLFINGDVTADGTEKQYAKLNSMVSDRAFDIPIYANMGNHDIAIDAGNGKYENPDNLDTTTLEYQEAMQKEAVRRFNAGISNNEKGSAPYFAFEQNNSKFIMLGTDVYEANNGWANLSETQLKWLENELDSANADMPVFVFLHQGIQNTVSGTAKLQIKPNDDFKTILNKYSNVILLSGHSHADMIKALTHDATRPNYLPAASGTNPTIFNTSSVMKRGQGYFVYVYDGYVVFKGRQYNENEWISEAQYVFEY